MRDFLVITIIVHNICRSGNVEGMTVKNMRNAKLETIDGVALYKIKVSFLGLVYFNH